MRTGGRIHFLTPIILAAVAGVFVGRRWARNRVSFEALGTNAKGTAISPAAAGASEMENELSKRIEHANRLWEAERETAALIASRIALISGAMIALLGLSSFGLVWLQQAPVVLLIPGWLAATMSALLTISLLAFLIAFGRLYFRQTMPPGTPPTSTEIMDFDPDGPTGATTPIILEKIYNGYVDLRIRNSFERRQMDLGQRVFAVGVLCIMATILVYLAGSLPYKLYPEALNYEASNASGR